MTEKEKAGLGMLYDANHDEELNDDYMNAALLLFAIIIIHCPLSRACAGAF